MPIAKNLRYGNHLIPDVGLADRSEARGGTRTCTFGSVSDNPWVAPALSFRTQTAPLSNLHLRPSCVTCAPFLYRS